jgi:hypothetical protein
MTRAGPDQDELADIEHQHDASRTHADASPAVEGDALGEPAAVPRDSWRNRIRANPAAHQAYRVVVFAVGLLCIAAGFALSVLPGPLTIPPVLLGLWVWSTEFGWAQRLFERFKVKGRQAWQHAKRHPVSSAAITLGGIVAVVVCVWALRYFQVVAVVREAVGL